MSAAEEGGVVAPAAEVAAPVVEAAPVVVVAEPEAKPEPVPEPKATPKGSSRRAAAKAAAAAPPPAADVVVVPDPAAELAEARAEVARVTAESAAKDVRHAFEAAGVTDPEGRELIEHLYAKAKAPEGGEKPTLAAWLADRASLPKGALAYLPAVSANGTPIPAAVDLPDENNGARPAPSSAPLNAAAISSMIGNLDAYAQNRDAIMARLGGKPAIPARP